MDFYNLYGVSYNCWEIDPPAQKMGTTSRVWFNQVVESYDLLDVFGEANGEKMWARYLKHFKVKGVDHSSGGLLLHLAGYHDSVIRWLNSWIVDMRLRVLNVSGDDTYYDYYPNELDLLGQFVRQTNDKEVIRAFNQLVDRIMTHEDSPYKDDTEDTITDDYKI